MEDQDNMDSKDDNEYEPTVIRAWHEKDIRNEQEWDSFLEKLQEESFLLNLELKDHYDAWRKIVDTAAFKQNESEIIFDCMKKMIDSMPVGTLTKGEDWFCYIKGIYYLKKTNKLSSESAEMVLKLAEKKLAYSYTKASKYWKTIRIEERKLCLPDNLYIQKCLETYKQQFTIPYMYMSQDFKEFLHFSVEAESQLDVDDILAVESNYTEKAAEAKRITSTYLNIFDEQYHHVQFEEWICRLLDRSPPLYQTALALCEEAVVDEKYSVCYHFVLAKTIVRGVNSDLFKQDKLFKVLKRGIFLGRYGCENIVFYFLDFALNAASSYLSSIECQELIDNIIHQFTFEESVSNFFASRKALIFGLKTLVDKKKLAVKDMQIKIVEALKPVTNEKLDKTSLEMGKKSLPDFELRCVELKKLSLLTEKQVTGITWKETFDKWEDVISKTTVPEVLVQYASFIREHGSSSDAEKAYLKSIKYINDLMNHSPYSTYSMRRCLFVLINNLRELVGIYGGNEDIIQLLTDLSRNQALSSLNSNEMYYLDYHPQLLKEDVAKKVFLNAEYENDENAIEDYEAAQYPVCDSSRSTIVDQMEKLKVESQKDPSSGFTVFLSNLDYKATRKDIVNAFKQHGLNVVGIKMKTTPKKTNYGFAAIDFSSMEQANQAVSDFDRIKILGRETFISTFKEKVKYSAPIKPEPTVLFVSGLSQEWRDPKRIENALLPFGHIKSVEVSDKEGTAKIEYQMPGDTTIGSLKLEEIMGDSGVTIRKGYPGQKSSISKQVKVKHTRQENGTKGSFVKEIGPTSGPETRSKAEGVKTPLRTKSFVPRQSVSRSQTFVPRQLRQQMKKKIDVISPDVEASSSLTPTAQMSDETEELGPSKEKRTKVDSTSQGQKLTNSDFREMLKK